MDTISPCVSPAGRLALIGSGAAPLVVDVRRRSAAEALVPARLRDDALCAACRVQVAARAGRGTRDVPA